MHADTSLGACGWFHFACLVPFSVGVLIVNYALQRYGARLMDSRIDAITSILMISPAEAVLMFLTVAALASAATAGVAYLALPWAWRNEPLRDTFAHSLRTCWLLTTALLGPYLLCDTVTVMIRDALVDAWHLPSYDFDYYAAQWYLTLLLRLAWPVWSLYVVYRAVTMAREVNATERDPTCEQCGYNLSHVGAGDCCSECGYPLARSLSPQHRQLSDWERAPRGAGWTAFWRCTNDALWQPEALFRSVRLDGTPGGAMRFLLAQFVILILVLACVMVAYVWSEPRPHLQILDGVDVVLTVVLAAFGLWSLVATTSGLVGSAICRRNLVGPIGRIAVYTSGGFVLLASLAISLLVVAIRTLDVMQARYATIQRALLSWSIIAGAAVLWYVAIVIRRIKYIRYINLAETTYPSSETAPNVRGGAGS
ncbi:MAG: hypothetical protein H6817_12115 [Phycisphaerales bacterium]|nr:hypothetical protein [Phycisphaerales bacterium]